MVPAPIQGPTPSPYSPAPTPKSKATERPTDSTSIDCDCPEGYRCETVDRRLKQMHEKVGRLRAGLSGARRRLFGFHIPEHCEPVDTL